MSQFVLLTKSNILRVRCVEEEKKRTRKAAVECRRLYRGIRGGGWRQVASLSAGNIFGKIAEVMRESTA